VTCLDARQRAAVEAVCIDMHRPYGNAVALQLPTAEIVFDEFHVLQHASIAFDEVRRPAAAARDGDARRYPGGAKDGFDGYAWCRSADLATASPPHADNTLSMRRHALELLQENLHGL
jgi:transposase